MINVIIIDDHPIVRAGLRTVLQKATDILVLAEGSNARDAFHLVDQYHPDVLILDIHLPDMSGVHVTRCLMEKQATCRILALTALEDEETILGLLSAGVTGYVLKDEALEQMVSAVRSVAAGCTWLSPNIANRVIQRLKESPSNKKTTPQNRENPLDALTKREKEVLHLLAQGLDNQAIAKKLVITVRTVQNHVSNIYSKLGTSSRTQAALAAYRTGLTSLSTSQDEG